MKPAVFLGPQLALWVVPGTVKMHVWNPNDMQWCSRSVVEQNVVIQLLMWCKPKKWSSLSLPNLVAKEFWSKTQSVSSITWMWINHYIWKPRASTPDSLRCSPIHASLTSNRDIISHPERKCLYRITTEPCVTVAHSISHNMLQAPSDKVSYLTKPSFNYTSSHFAVTCAWNWL